MFIATCLKNGMMLIVMKISSGDYAMARVTRRKFLASSTATALVSTTAGSSSAESQASATVSASKLTSCSATQLACMLRERKVSSEEIVEAYIERIKKVNPKINAVVDTDFKEARRQAQQADKSIRQGGVFWKGQPLLGVPGDDKGRRRCQGDADDLWSADKEESMRQSTCYSCATPQRRGGNCLG